MEPHYLAIKRALLGELDAGLLAPGDKVPSENELGARFGVSRMTARRALDELADEGVLVRTQGLGSFVADERPSSNLVQVRNIAEEIAARGHRHGAQVLHLSALVADGRVARWLAVAAGSQVFRSQLLHLENDLPIQWEERWVNPRFAPDYLGQDFSRATPSSYLSKVAPLTEADHLIEAVSASAALQKQLQLQGGEPCLKVSRRTYSSQGVVSYAQLYHPGSRYRLGGHFRY